MKQALRRTAPAALVIAGLIVVSGTTGAVAGNLITSARIKDNTIQSRDIKNLTIQPNDTSAAFDKYTRRVSGYSVVTNTVNVPNGTSDNVTASCPSDTSILGTTGWWTNSTDAVQVEPQGTGDTSATAFGANSNGQQDTLHIALYCGRTAP